MSRIGRQPVIVPNGITVRDDGGTLIAKGPKGQMSLKMPRGITAALEEGKIVVSRPDESRQSKSLHGLARSLLAGAIEGVEKGFTKQLDLEGVGFKAEVQGRKLMLSIGFASPKEYVAREGVDIAVQGSTITVTGVDKQKVGDAAACIRSYYPPEPYKGKGIRYKGERVRRKAGKTVA
ncbi:MAG: 50S ribosomal protein L6 [Lentisphaerales bacterium]|jgi:large subunit ribosomal protein L6|nr:MAG: 50S ribosomal protein L6 [Lentisphaerales bacterium]